MLHAGQRPKLPKPPLSGGEMENNRDGAPWWDLLHEAGVDVEVYRIPGNYPTPPSDAKVLAGMGTTDIRGGYGTYTLYTDTLVAKDKPKGDVEYVSVRDLDLDGTPDTVTGALRGPPDQLHLEPGEIPSESQYITTPHRPHRENCIHHEATYRPRRESQYTTKPQIPLPLREPVHHDATHPA